MMKIIITHSYKFILKTESWM